MGEKLAIHPLANIFPLMTGSAYQEFVQDVRQFGVREPVTLFEGKVLDGRNRLKAAMECGAKIVTREFDGDDPVAFIISTNLRRRHLRESQRALVAARLTNVPLGANQRTMAHGSITQEVAAQLLNSSVSSIKRALIVTRCAIPGVVELVEQNKISCKAASKVAALSADQQRRLVQKGPSSIVAAARTKDRSGSGRNRYSQLYAIVDEICEALEGTRLDKADMAARRLSKKITEFVAAERRSK